MINNKNIIFHLKNWRSNIGYVPQNIFLLDDTFKKNISFYFEEKSNNLEKLHHCIQQAGLENLINTLPDGIDTVVGERGNRISGGQLQRVGIARALYHDPKI